MKFLYNKYLLTIIIFSYIPLDYSVFGSFEEIGKNITYTIRLLTAYIGGLLFLLNTLKVKNRLMLRVSIVFFLLFILLNIGTLLNFNFTISILVKDLLALGLYLFFIFILVNNSTEVLRGLRFSFRLLLILNIIIYFLVPEIGVYRIDSSGFPLLKGVLVNRNSVALYVVPLLVLEGFFTKRGRVNLGSLVFTYLSILILTFTGSDTALVVISTFIIIKVVFSRIKFPLYIATVILLIANLFIVLINVNNPIVYWFIERFFEGDFDFSGRTIIWDISIKHFLDSFLFGNGAGSNKIAESLGYKLATNENPFNDPFNGLLNILFFGGITGFIAFVVIQIYTIKKVGYLITQSKVYRNLIMFFISFYIISILESIFQFSIVVFWLFVIIVFVMSSESKEKKEVS